MPYTESNGTRNSSGDEIANVNFLYDDIVHVLQNTIDSCINSDTHRSPTGTNSKISFLQNRPSPTEKRVKMC